MIVCDTGPLLAAANADDSEHTVCLATLADATGPLIVPALIVTEVCYMLAKSGPDAEAAFPRSLAAGELARSSDYTRMADLVVQYGKFPLGAADASVIAVAERLGSTTVATLDHRQQPSADCRLWDMRAIWPSCPNRGDHPSTGRPAAGP